MLIFSEGKEKRHVEDVITGFRWLLDNPKYQTKHLKTLLDNNMGILKKEDFGNPGKWKR